MNNESPVTAEIGFGNTKTVKKNTLTGLYEYSVMPSTVVEYDETCHLLSSNKMRDEFIVTVKDKRYIVGKDAYLSGGTYQNRILTTNFINTDEYYALFLASLCQINESNIPFLAAGLPARLYTNQNIKQLKKIMTGTHNLPGDRKVTIHKVMVLAQPIAALIDYGLSNDNYSAIRAKTNLIIDFGYLTTDWTISEGIQPMNKRTGSIAEGGVNSLVDQIIKIIRIQENIEYTARHKLERDMLSGHISINGERRPLDDYLLTATDVINPALNAMVNNVGELYDVDTIILSGGGSRYFKKAVREKFPDHEIIIQKDAHLSIARGLQIAAEQVLAHKIGGAA